MTHEHVFVHPPSTIARALELASAGRNACEIYRETGVPARTVCRWLRGELPRRLTNDLDVPAEEIAAGKPRAYAYLLGLYLGDGHIARMPRTYSLRITLDSSYPAIIESAAAAIEDLIPDSRAGRYPRAVSNCTDVVSYSRFWPRLLPQHGPGRKHLRSICLVDWQSAITGEHPRALIRGLIHSDGCRFVANQRVGARMYSYARYCFNNKSLDILSIFCGHLDLLGIPWTRQRHDAIQVARAEGVAQLDSFVGPKR